MDLQEELKSAGTYPTGPVSAWPEERNNRLLEAMAPKKVKATPAQMATGLVKNASAFIKGGKVSKEVYDSRYGTCEACPSFLKKSNRCSECGCFMKAKAWINEDPDLLCPLKKWIK
jgi:hypothetical protein